MIFATLDKNEYWKLSRTIYCRLVALFMGKRENLLKIVIVNLYFAIQ